MIGSSMGGYAAIRAGLALNARAVLAFSPQVYLGEERASLVGGAMPWRAWRGKARHPHPVSAYADMQTGLVRCTQNV